jgi:hypothetical protein
MMRGYAEELRHRMVAEDGKRPGTYVIAAAAFCRSCQIDAESPGKAYVRLDCVRTNR